MDLILLYLGAFMVWCVWLTVRELEEEGERRRAFLELAEHDDYLRRVER